MTTLAFIFLICKMEIIIGPSSQVMCGSNKIIELKCLKACQAYRKHLISEVIVYEVYVPDTRLRSLHG